VDVLAAPLQRCGEEGRPSARFLVVDLEALAGVEVGEASFVVVFPRAEFLSPGKAVLIPPVTRIAIGPGLLRLQDEVDLGPGQLQ